MRPWWRGGQKGKKPPVLPPKAMPQAPPVAKPEAVARADVTRRRLHPPAAEPVTELQRRLHPSAAKAMPQAVARADVTRRRLHPPAADPPSSDSEKQEQEENLPVSHRAGAGARGEPVHQSIFELNRSEPKAMQYVRPSWLDEAPRLDEDKTPADEDETALQKEELKATADEDETPADEDEDETPAELASLREEELKATARCKQLEEEVAALQKELAELAGPQSEMDKTRADEKATFDKNHPEMVTAAEPVTELAGKGDQAHAELAARARATRRVTEPWMAARLGIALSEPLPPAPSPTDPNRWGRFDPDEHGPAQGLRSAPPAEPVESESSMARAVKRFKKATLDA